MKAEKGITLVALVITIIVLLILAMVSITIFLDSGIVPRANNAVTKYNEAQNNEMLQLNAADDYMNDIESKLS